MFAVIVAVCTLTTARPAAAQTAPPTYDELVAQVQQLTTERDAAIAERDQLADEKAALSADLSRWRASAIQYLRLYGHAVYDLEAMRRELIRTRYAYKVYRHNVVNKIRRLIGLPPIGWTPPVMPGTITTHPPR